MLLLTETGITEIVKALAELIIAAGTVIGIIVGVRSKKVSKVNSGLIKEVHDVVNSGQDKKLKDAEELGNLKGRREQTEENKNGL